MLSMTEKWKQALDNGKVVGIIFVDFQKAFDSICHKKTLNETTCKWNLR